MPSAVTHSHDGAIETAAGSTALKRSRSQLHRLQLRFRAVLDNIELGISLYDGRGRLVVCNQHFLDIYRLPASLGKRGTTFRRILEARVSANTHVGDDAEAYISERLALVPGGRVTGGINRLNSGQVISVTHQPIDGGGWVSTHKDITQLYTMQAELAHLAYHDPLTGLPNRTVFYQRLEQAFEALEATGFAILSLDLDGFKPINDSLGHAAGDALLRQFADRLRALASPLDTVARMGGDEFAILLPEGNAATATMLARRIEAAMHAPFEFDGQVASIAAGIGMALAPWHGRTTDQLLHSADLALYAAKRERRGGIKLFDPQLDAAAAHRRRMDGDLRRALDNGEFELFYQPILDLRTARFSGFEALIRWQHPERGLVSPAEFVPLAEELGLIVPIGEWALHQAFDEAARWPADFKVAVNVSSIQIARGRLVPSVTSALRASGVSADRVELEITESVFAESNAASLEALRELRAQGVRIALDDFGTGFSALSYLIAFPFDKIKIDGSFVRALDDAQAANTIVRAVADIGARMGMTTTAEGIETAQQLRSVHDVGYGEAQGYLISRPLSRDAVRRMLTGAFDPMPEAPLLRAG